MPVETAFSQQEILNVRKVKEICRAIDHELRQEILNYIHKKGEANVTEIIRYLREDQSVISQHLAILRKAGIVKTERDGKIIRYSIHLSNVQMFNNCFSYLISN